MGPEVIGDSRIRAARTTLKVLIFLGLGLALLDPAWIDAGQAVSVDAILSPEELRDRKLIDVVYRTHRHETGSFVLPHRAFGVATVVSAIVALVLLRDAAKRDA
jgi:hypothetical protein